MSKRNYSRELELKKERVNSWERDNTIINLDNYDNNYERKYKTEHWDFD